jgi:hypothetical protein
VTRRSKGQTRRSKGQTRRSKGQTRRSKGQTRRSAPTAPAAGIDEATPQGPKRQTAAGGQSDFRSYCPPPAGPFSDRGVARKARLPPKKIRKIPGRSRAKACLGSDQKQNRICLRTTTCLGSDQKNTIYVRARATTCLGSDWLWHALDWIG